MDAIEAIMSRRSVRSYTDEPVSDEAVELLLRAAMNAPSARNQQPWEFVVIRDRAVLAEVPKAHPYAQMVPSAQVAIVVCADMRRVVSEGFWIQDCAAATENILIAANALGLGAVWLGVYPRDARVDGLRRLLGLPGHIVPFSLIPVGHPAERPPKVDRFDTSRIHRDRW